MIYICIIYIYIYLFTITYIYIYSYIHTTYIHMCDTWVCLKIGFISQFIALSRLENEVVHRILGILRQTQTWLAQEWFLWKWGTPKTIQFVAHFWWETHSGILGSVSRETWSALKQHSSGIWLKQNWKKRVKHENSKKSG